MKNSIRHLTIDRFKFSFPKIPKASLGLRSQFPKQRGISFFPTRFTLYQRDYKFLNSTSKSARIAFLSPHSSCTSMPPRTGRPPQSRGDPPPASHQMDHADSVPDTGASSESTASLSRALAELAGNPEAHRLVLVRITPSVETYRFVTIA